MYLIRKLHVSMLAAMIVAGNISAAVKKEPTDAVFPRVTCGDEVIETVLTPEARAQAVTNNKRELRTAQRRFGIGIGLYSFGGALSWFSSWFARRPGVSSHQRDVLEYVSAASVVCVGIGLCATWLGDFGMSRAQDQKARLDKDQRKADALAVNGDYDCVNSHIHPVTQAYIVDGVTGFNLTNAVNAALYYYKPSAAR